MDQPCVIVIDGQPYDVAAHYARKTPPMELPATPTMAVVEIIVASGRQVNGYEIVEEDELGNWLGDPIEEPGQALPLRDGQRFSVFPISRFGTRHPDRP